MGQLLKFMFVGLLGLLVLGMVVNAINEAKMTPEQRELVAAEKAAKAAEANKPAPPERLAKTACKNFINLRLNDPDSAEFPYTSDWPSVALKDGKYRVMANLRAKNAFGALMLAEFQCDVRLDNRGWTLVDLKQISP